MNNQNQTPHFPCGPCPLIDEISAQIDCYRVVLLHLVPSVSGDHYHETLTDNEKEIKLIRQFILSLESLYNLANAALTEDTIGETPK